MKCSATNESSKFTHSYLPWSNYNFSREQCQRKVARPAKFIHSCVHFLTVATSDTANLIVRTSVKKTCYKKKKKKRKGKRTLHPISLVQTRQPISSQKSRRKGSTTKGCNRQKPRRTSCTCSRGKGARRHGWKKRPGTLS